MKKVALVAQMLEKRIAHADHVLGGIPSERQLAEEMGFSRSTVRNAVQSLVENGTLTRQENGRLDIAAPINGTRRRIVSVISPSGQSGDVDQWRESIDAVLNGSFGSEMVTVRSFTYGHWADPAIQEALSGSDAAFLLALAEDIPIWLVDKIKDSSCRVVVLDQDKSHVGLPSVTLFPPAMEFQLLDYLYQLGHRHIDCLNAQERGSVIEGRISAWENYLEARDVKGQLYSMEMRNPHESSYRLMRDAIEEGKEIASALFCTTGPAAMGAMRALHEAGLKIGSDVSVCAINSEGVGRYLMPSLTALEAPPRALYLRRVSHWMLSDEKWQGPLLIQPEGLLLFEGESTGAPSVSTLSGPSGPHSYGFERKLMTSSLS
ncbi:MAG: GntR family transcriptional regulator [Proteobacteria bacterium]|nr:MAG: GntR family transcriptional regulator [Pseudomonadota bacterium]